MRHVRRLPRLVAAILMCLVGWRFAAPAVASCDSGSVPVALDIRDIRIHRFNFVGAQTPGFELTLRRASEYEHGRSIAYKPVATLQVLKSMSLLRGAYALDGDAVPFSERIASELTGANVFDMRLSPIDDMCLDGPEDEISVLRCAARFSITTIPTPVEWLNLSDENAKHFFALLDRIGALIAARHWSPIATPQPEATP